MLPHDVIQRRRAPVSWRSAPLMPVLAVLGSAAWILAGPRTPDLGAQMFRAQMFAAHGFTLYDAQWYGGHLMPAYSVLFPPVAALLGVRVTGALSTIAAVVLFERLVRARYGARAWRGAAWFALLAGMNLLSARLAFALGLALGLGCLLAVHRARPRLGLALAVLCSLASPLAGMFLVLAGATWAWAERRRWPALVSLAAGLTLLGLETAFPEGGTFGFPATQLIPLLLVLCLGPLLLTRADRVLRMGFVAYGGLVLLAYLIPSPVGSNAVRLGILVCGPVLACALSGRRLALLGVLTPLLLLWSWAPTASDLGAASAGASDAAYFAPLNAFLGRVVHAPTRLEIPFTRGHWESVFVAPRYMLARGWERQLDRGDNPIFYGAGHRALSAPAYYRWLRDQAVSYVALSTSHLDSSAIGERALILRRPPYLRQVWRSRNWRVYAVRRRAPLLSGPGELIRQGADSLSIRVRHAGRFLLRLHYSPYWKLAGRSGCVGLGRGGWTALRLTQPGIQRLTTEFSLDHDAGCA